jgi:hypothetical protein
MIMDNFGDSLDMYLHEFNYKGKMIKDFRIHYNKINPLPKLVAYSGVIIPPTDMEIIQHIVYNKEQQTTAFSGTSWGLVSFKKFNESDDYIVFVCQYDIHSLILNFDGTYEEFIDMTLAFFGI